jgi:hypothetical protein
LKKKEYEYSNKLKDLEKEEKTVDDELAELERQE